jgi:MFS family permease
MIWLALGMEIVGFVIAGWLIGAWLDQRYGWGGMGLASGVMGSIVLFLVHAIALFQKSQAKEEQGETERLRAHQSGVGLGDDEKGPRS